MTTKYVFLGSRTTWEESSRRSRILIQFNNTPRSTAETSNAPLTSGRSANGSGIRPFGGTSNAEIPNLCLNQALRFNGEVQVKEFSWGFSNASIMPVTIC